MEIVGWGIVAVAGMAVMVVVGVDATGIAAGGLRAVAGDGVAAQFAAVAVGGLSAPVVGKECRSGHSRRNRDSHHGRRDVWWGSQGRGGRIGQLVVT